MQNEQYEQEKIDFSSNDEERSDELVENEGAMNLSKMATMAMVEKRA